MSLEDIYGKRIRLKRVRADTPGLLPAGTIATKMVLIDEETGRELDVVFDAETHVYTPQGDGTYLVSRVVQADNTQRLLDK